MNIVTSVFKIKCGDMKYNASKIIEICEREEGDVYLFPAYVLTGISCGALSQMKGFKDRLDEAIDMLCTYTEKNNKAIVTSAQEYGNIVIFKGDIDNSGKFTRDGLNVTISKNGTDKGDIILIPTAMAGYPCIKNDIHEFCAQASLKGQNTVAVANCGFGESSADDVFKGFCGIFRNGVTTAFMAMDDPETIVAKAPHTKTDGIVYSRPRNVADRVPYYGRNDEKRYITELALMQIQALYTRIEGSGLKKLCINVSGGLDSTLALLASVEAAKMAGLNASDIIALSLPCFGTSEKTAANADKLVRLLGVEGRKIDIKNAVSSHLADISHCGNKDAAYENAQSRERTQILFDVANTVNGLCIGTGDMSEAALGFCTFGGDTQCHYNVNAGIPKTLVKALVKYYAEKADEDLRAVLSDVIETPISPELIEGQKTEDIVGPYILHDFIMFYFAKHKFTRADIRNYCFATFDEYSDDEIDKCIDTFFTRFINSRFKRAASCEGANLLGFRLPYYPADMQLEF